jgi:hypothetical protein
MILDPQGYLSRESASIAVQLNIGHNCTRTVEDEAEQLAQLRFANSLFPMPNAHYANARDAPSFYPAKVERLQMEQRKGLDPVSNQGSILAKQQQRPMQRSP